jgi:hypothetical protein
MGKYKHIAIGARLYLTKQQTLGDFHIGLAGAFLAVYGMFGYFFVIGPPLVKLACGGALLYALIRSGWSFWQA